MVFVNDVDPSQIPDYKAVTETVANELEFDDNLAVFFTGEGKSIFVVFVSNRLASKTLIFFFLY